MMYSRYAKKMYLSAVVMMALVLGTVSHATVDTQELNDAFSWMQDNGYTYAESITAFQPNKSIKREEGAKYFSQFAQNVLGMELDTSLTKCERFSDLDSSSYALQDYLVQACQLGILKGTNNKINPKQMLTNSQAVGIVMRMLDPQNSEQGGNNRASMYYVKANKLGLLKNLNMNNKKGPISRGNLTVLLYRAGGEQGGIDSSSTENSAGDDVLTGQATSTVTSGIAQFKNDFYDCNVGGNFTAQINLTTLGKGITAMYYEILGPKNGKCEIKSTYIKNPNATWVGKGMSCLYNNDLSFEEASAELGSRLSSCTGPLKNLLLGK